MAAKTTQELIGSIRDREKAKQAAEDEAKQNAKLYEVIINQNKDILKLLSDILEKKTSFPAPIIKPDIKVNVPAPIIRVENPKPNVYIEPPKNTINVSPAENKSKRFVFTIERNDRNQIQKIICSKE